MQTSHLSYQSTGKFNQLIIDYLAQEENLRPFYHRFPTLDAFADQIKEKKSSFAHRDVLVQALRSQHSGIESGSGLIDRLENENCFTVTTGHQLCLFTGPLYFIFKIVTTINLAAQLREEYPDQDFVPVFWMASEDHDFDEVNHLYLNHQKVFWESGQGGAVGRMKLTAIDEALDSMAESLGESEHATTIMTLLRKIFSSEEKTLAEATRNLVYALFDADQILVIDGDDKALKQLFAPTVKRELTDQFSDRAVAATNEKLGEHYKLQVSQREINLFYLDDQLRERIVYSDGKYAVLHTNLEFTPDEIIREVENHPEKFSPNVILRPLYQETILPNLCYIGGGGELAYWFQLKEMFGEAKITFPVLLLRNSAMWISRNETRKMEKLNLSVMDLFQDREQLVKTIVHEKSEQELSLDPEKRKLNDMFREISERILKIDPTLEKMVLADGARTSKTLHRIEKRMMRAEKERHSLTISQISNIFDRLFPAGGLQERHSNYFDFYLRYGRYFMNTLFENLDPLRPEFTVFEER